MKRLILELFNEKGEKETFKGAPQIAAKKLAEQHTLEGEEFYIRGKLKGFLTTEIEFESKKLGKDELPNLLNKNLETCRCLVCQVANLCAKNPFNPNVMAIHVIVI